jgi:hypothetical protein
MDRRQTSEAGKTQAELAKVYPRLRFAGQLVLSDARRFQLMLSRSQNRELAAIVGDRDSGKFVTP